jgi:phenylalanyl-tRNA synthetase beta chain
VDLEAWAREAGGELLRSAAIVDRYEGPPVPEGQVSLTLGLTFQHPARTLTGDEVQAAVDGIVAALRSRGAEIRGE